MVINQKYLRAFELIHKLEPDRPRILTPLPDSFTPFWNHPYNVMKNVIILGENSNEVLTAAILHDVLEDTDYTEEDMRKEFGDFVTDVVKAVSKSKDYTHEDSHRYYTNIHTHPDMAVRKASCFIKLADRIDNLLSVVITEDGNRYLGETEKYFKMIAKEIGKEAEYENLIEASKEIIEDK